MVTHKTFSEQTSVPHYDFKFMLTYLVHGAEDVSIILLEATDTGEARQSSWQLIPVQDTKVGHAKGQLSPGARPVIKHQTGAKQTNRQSE